MPALAQYPLAWNAYKDLGNYGDENATSIVNAPGGGFYVTAFGYTPGGGGNNGILRKLDETGAVVWTRLFPGSVESALANSSGVVAVGYVGGYGADAPYLTAEKYDPSGNLIWARTLDPDVAGFTIPAALDPAGNVLLCAYVLPPFRRSNLNCDCMVIKLNGATGGTIFKQHAGVSVQYPYFEATLSDPSADTYLVAQGASNTVLSKFDPAGSLLWSTGPVGIPNGLLVDPTGNSFLIWNNASDGTGYVSKYDTNGHALWTKPLGSTIQYAAEAALTTTGNLIVAWQDLGYDIKVSQFTPAGVVQAIGSTPGQIESERGRGHIALDSSNNIYVVGNPPISAATSTLLAKFSASGGVAWTRTEVGSGSWDFGSSVVIDPQGRAIFLSTISNVPPTGMDSRVSAYDSAGNKIWSQDYDPKSTGEFIYTAVTDGAGNTYGTSGSAPTSLVRFDTNGKVLWTRQLSTYGPGFPTPRPQIEPNGNVVVPAWFADSGIGEVGTLFCYDPSGNLVWQYDLTQASQRLMDFRIAADGSVYLSFYVLTKSGTVSTSSVRLVRLSPSGTLLWGLNKPSTVSEFPYEIACDGSSNCYLECFTGASGNYASTVAKFNSSGSLLWQTALPQADVDSFSIIRTDPAGNVLVLDNDLTSGRYLNKLDPAGNVLWVVPVAASWPPGSTPFVVDALGNSFVGSFTESGYDFAEHVQKYLPSGALAWSADYPLTPNSELLLQADGSGGVAVLVTEQGSLNSTNKLFKLSANGNFSWPASGGAFVNHTIVNNSAGLDQLATALTSDAKGNLYVSGGGYGQSGTFDLNVAKYWANNDDSVSQTVPTKMDAGETYTLSVSFRNTGFNTWTSAAGYKLAVLGANWGVSSVPFASTDAIGPGATKTFSFRVYAPLTSGVYNIQFKLYNHTTGFGVLSPLVPVTVSLRPDGSRFMVQAVPTSVKAGSTFTVTVDMRNVGTNTWTQATGFTLDPASGYPGWGITGVVLSPTDSIAQGQDKVFSFTCVAPPTLGTYNMRWQMFQQGFGFFGDKSFTKGITVTP